MKYITTMNGKKFEVEIRNDNTVWVNGKQRTVDFLSLGPTLFSIIMDNAQQEVVVENREDAVEVLLKGRLYSGTVLDERAQLMRSRRGGDAAESGEVTVRAPMPGLIVAVLVSEGEQVKAGQTLVILESMKMQNELKAPRAGTVQRVSIQSGTTVEQRKVLVTLT
jgi:biotin carboxyl carrier protein